MAKKKPGKIWPIIGAVFAIFGGFILYSSYNGIKTGELLSRAGRVTATRQDEPIEFWIMYMTFLLVGFLMIYLGILLIKGFFEAHSDN